MSGDLRRQLDRLAKIAGRRRGTDIGDLTTWAVTVLRDVLNGSCPPWSTALVVGLVSDAFEALQPRHPLADAVRSACFAVTAAVGNTSDQAGDADQSVRGLRVALDELLNPPAVRAA